MGQIKQQLISEGYDGSEVDNALKRSKRKSVHDLASYIRKAIENERRQSKRILPAQDFAQRDYTGVQDEMMCELAEEMKQYKKQEAASK